MMVSSELLTHELLISDDAPAVLVLENKRLFRKILDFFEDGCIDELLVFSEAFKPVPFSKRGLFIRDVLNLSFNDKKLMSRVNQTLEELAETEEKHKLEDLKQRLIVFGDSLTAHSDYELKYGFEGDTASLIKFFGFSVNRTEMTHAEATVAFMELFSKYLGIRFFVIQNLHLYFEPEEISAVLKSAQYRHLELLLLECAEPKVKINGVNYTVIDSDLCVFDNCNSE